jgi:hypothetical protein
MDGPVFGAHCRPLPDIVANFKTFAHDANPGRRRLRGRRLRIYDFAQKPPRLKFLAIIRLLTETAAHDSRTFNLSFWAILLTLRKSAVKCRIIAKFFTLDREAAVFKLSVSARGAGGRRGSWAGSESVSRVLYPF